MKLILPILLALPLSGCAATERTNVHSFGDYNYVVGTQTFGSKYQFTDEPRLVETAREIRAMGSNLIKFRLEPTFGADNYSGPEPGDFDSLTALASGDPAIRTVMEMPFTYYFLWVTPMQPCSWRDDDGYTDEDAAIEYREIYDLTRHLLETWSGTGKRFFLGNWEGDWMLLRGFDRTKDPHPRDVRNMIKWVNNRQRAVDDAKRDTNHENVAVYHYLELVLVEKGIRGRPCIATEVLPHAPVDYISYSAYEMQNDHDLRAALDRVLGFIERQLPPKPGVPGRRVFVGEFGRQGNTVGPETQRDHAVEFIRAALDWGSPFVLWWQLYGNEIEDGKHRGYWLIDDTGKEWPLYRTLHAYYEKARRFLAEYAAREGRLPDAGVFADHAAGFLGGASRFADIEPEPAKPEGFEAKLPDNWKIAGGGVSITSEDPYSGLKHLRLAADGSPNQWAAASCVKPAAPGEVWQARIRARRLSGPIVRMKLEFRGEDGDLLRVISRTSVDNRYVPLGIIEEAPPGTAKAHLVAAVESGTEADPVVGHFDDAVLHRMAE